MEWGLSDGSDVGKTPVLVVSCGETGLAKARESFVTQISEPGGVVPGGASLEPGKYLEITVNVLKCRSHDEFPLPQSRQGLLRCCFERAITLRFELEREFRTT